MMGQTEYYLRTTCRMCLSDDLEKVIELTATPPGNNFVNKENVGIPQTNYPLDLYFCNKCNHLQLGHIVKPEILYQNDYSYVSSTSAHFVKHLEDYANDIIERFTLSPDNFVIDIGSNDGTCLKFFKEKGLGVLGVDPASNIAQIAVQAGIPTIADFFSIDVAKKIKSQYGNADFITSHNACAHIDDLDSVIEGVSYLLGSNGVFCLEVGYFYDVYSNTWFDTIYHEHLDYHTVGPFIELFSRFDMELISVERVSPQGGSIRLMAQKLGGKYKKDTSIRELIELERNTGLNKVETYRMFEKHINSIRDRLKALIRKLKEEGKTIAGFGAPTKATTLMSHFGLGSDELSFIVDENPLKQGLYTPGTHVPVLPADAIYEHKPDYLLILAWNFAKPIMENHSGFIKQGGKFILPMPEPEIVN